MVLGDSNWLVNIKLYVIEQILRAWSSFFKANGKIRIVIFFIVYSKI